MRHELRRRIAQSDPLPEYAASAESVDWAIIAGAGGAAHPGSEMCAAKTTLPVLGAPAESKAPKSNGPAASIVQMPAGIPVATLAIGPLRSDQRAAPLAASILANKYPDIKKRCTSIGSNKPRQCSTNP